MSIIFSPKTKAGDNPLGTSTRPTAPTVDVAKPPAGSDAAPASPAAQAPVWTVGDVFASVDKAAKDAAGAKALADAAEAERIEAVADVAAQFDRFEVIIINGKTLIRDTTAPTHYREVTPATEKTTAIVPGAVAKADVASKL